MRAVGRHEWRGDEARDSLVMAGLETLLCCDQLDGIASRQLPLDSERLVRRCGALSCRRAPSTSRSPLSRTGDDKPRYVRLGCVVERESSAFTETMRGSIHVRRKESSRGTG